MVVIFRVAVLSLAQIVVLARVIVDQDQVNLTADGVTQLTSVLKSDDDNAVILAGLFILNKPSVIHGHRCSYCYGQKETFSCSRASPEPCREPQAEEYKVGIIRLHKFLKYPSVCL